MLVKWDFQRANARFVFFLVSLHKQTNQKCPSIRVNDIFRIYFSFMLHSRVKSGGNSFYSSRLYHSPLNAIYVYINILLFDLIDFHSHKHISIDLHKKKRDHKIESNAFFRCKKKRFACRVMLSYRLMVIFIFIFQYFQLVSSVQLFSQRFYHMTVSALAIWKLKWFTTLHKGFYFMNAWPCEFGGFHCHCSCWLCPNFVR